MDQTLLKNIKQIHTVIRDQAHSGREKNNFAKNCDPGSPHFTDSLNLLPLIFYNNSRGNLE